tara:strand:- start:110 stop:781 length:672 start_codon:yes stop_codon:yes gene_type:complete
MLVPTIIADNFYENCDEVVHFANTLSYQQDAEGKWPGLRSEPLHEVSNIFFGRTCKKIISLMYPMEGHVMGWEATCYFQKIKMNPKEKEFTEGWVHHDYPLLFTAIIYLSSHTDVGTSVVMPKSIFSHIKHVSTKNEKNRRGKAPNFKEKLLENNSQFQESIKVNSGKNRIFIFDSSQYHFVHNMNSVENREDRLTLVCFFKDLKHANGVRWGIPEMLKNREL